MTDKELAQFNLVYALRFRLIDFETFVQMYMNL